MFVASGVLYVLAEATRAPGDWVTAGTVSETVTFLAFLAFPIVGALVASRRPENPIGWICLADGLLWMLLSGRWRPLAWFSGVVILLLSVAGGLAPGPLENQGRKRNPFGIEALPW